jgi:transcriptional regulator with XRE-family HTH domain
VASSGIMFQEKESSRAEKKADKDALRLAVTMLRAFRGWSQSELAAAAGLGASAVSRYESGAQEPSRRTFDRIVAAVGVRPLLVRSLLTWIRKARAEVMGGEFPNSLDDMIESSTLELAESFSAMLRRAAADLEASRKSAQPDPPAEELWANLKDVPVEDRRFLIEEARELQSWQFCTFLCDKSLEAAGNRNAAEALELARLAVRAAEMSWEQGSWKLCLKGYALAHLAAALQASGDLDQAEEAMQRARILWDAGEPGDSSPLNEDRLLELESSLLSRSLRGRKPEARTPGTARTTMTPKQMGW